jgi:hypothetical protein
MYQLIFILYQLLTCLFHSFYFLLLNLDKLHFYNDKALFMKMMLTFFFIFLFFIFSNFNKMVLKILSGLENIIYDDLINFIKL